MPGPRATGALLYAKDMDRLSAFYRELLSMTLLVADADHQVIENVDCQLIIHAIPPHIAATFTISTPPEPREAAAIKLFFTVPQMSAASATVTRLGGAMIGASYAIDGTVIRNGCDIEGNIFHLRAPA